MKHHFYNISVIIILSIIPFVSNYSQWHKSYIDTQLSGANQISVADINLDGKLDIVISAENTNQVVWYENPDWEKHIIDSNLMGVLGVATADIDGDDTVDVVAAGYNANDVVWYENNHPTWTKHPIDNDFLLAALPVVGDVNGDGNLDVIVGGGFTNAELVWYENNDLQWNRNIITNATPLMIGNVYALDIDKNGKIDIFPTRGDSLNSYESQDNGTSWIQTTIDDNLGGSWDCFADYINDDNNLDIIGIAGGHFKNNGGGLFWYNKTDSIWIKNQIDNEVKNYACVLDFDGDGKNDIATTDDHKVNLYKNNLPNGWEKKVIDSDLSWAWHMQSADLDEDGLSDLIVSDFSANKLIFYKNLSYNAYATSMEISPKFFHLHGDTITINATIENPKEHSAEVFAIINGDKDSFQDSIQLFDDGLHSDEDASDNIWGEKWLLNLSKDFYTVSLFIKDLTANFSYAPLLKSYFTTIGPVVLDSFSVLREDNSIGITDMYLTNLSDSITIMDVSAKISTNDTNVTSIRNSDLFFNVIFPNESHKSSLGYMAFDIQNEPTEIKFLLEICSNKNPYWYDTLVVDLTPTDIENTKTNIPTNYVLNQNYPNPFNPRTTIKYSIPKQSNVTLKVYDVLGSKVSTILDEKQSQGNYEVEFDGSELTSGIYFYRLKAGDYVETKKMLLLK